MTHSDQLETTMTTSQNLLLAPDIPPLKRSLKKSLELKTKAQKLIPSCTQTFSKAPTQYVQGVAPCFIERGEGSHVWDVDGNEYIDYPMALGPIILGHNDADVNQAVIDQLQQGTVFSMAHPLEIEVAEMLTDLIPCAEMVRYGKNGSDATSGAVRVARAFTGRNRIACCGYHGWQDWYVGTTTRNLGVPDAVQALTHPFTYNDLESLETIFRQHPGEIAAVIMEPVGVVPPEDDFLQNVQALAKREGALLIFDEIVTGFRLALGGAQKHFDVKPDLACVGKAMGNGFPIAAVVGRSDVMAKFDDIFFSFTFAGDAVGLAAAKATIQKMQRQNVIAHLWEHGQCLHNGIQTLISHFDAADFVNCLGYAPRTVIGFKDFECQSGLSIKSLFQQECLKRGVLFLGGQNLCFAHNKEDIAYTLQVYKTALSICADAVSSGMVSKQLEGDPVKPVFRQP